MGSSSHLAIGVLTEYSSQFFSLVQMFYLQLFRPEQCQPGTFNEYFESVPITGTLVTVRCLPSEGAVRPALQCRPVECAWYHTER